MMPQSTQQRLREFINAIRAMLGFEPLYDNGGSSAFRRRT